MAITINHRRRWFGLLHLILSGGMLIWGLTLLRPVLRGWWFIGYWLACLVFALLALTTGWLDWRSVRRQLREERRHLLLEALEAPDPKHRPPPPRPARPTPKPPAAAPGSPPGGGPDRPASP